MIFRPVGEGRKRQEMVYGKYGDDSGTGVAFTRDPATAKRKLLVNSENAQGEDVVQAS